MTTAPRKLWLALCLLLIVTLCAVPIAAAQEGTAGPTSPPSPEAGASIYPLRCANCHGTTGQGDGAQALQANLAVPDLTDPALLRQTTPARWFDIISNGVAGEAMPPFGEASSNPLRQVDRWDLVFYLYTLGAAPEQVAMGQALYEMSCAECHGADGAGGPDAPGFTELATMAIRSQADLFAAISDTTIQGHEAGLGEVEVWALTDYLRTFTYDYVAPAAAGASSTASPFTGGAGVVEGVVTNGTAGAAAPVGLVVSLRAFDMNANFIDAITTTVASDGSYRFTGIDATIPAQLEPLANYLGVAYLADLESVIVLSPEQPEARANMTVYETTADDSAIRIERLHVVFDFAADRVQVLEFYILSNDGDRAYVGTMEGGTLRLSVPANALSFQPGGDAQRYLTLADGIADTAPIPPGQSTTQSMLVYEMAYDDGLELSRPMPYPVTYVNIFVPADAGVEVSGNGIQPGEAFQAQDTTLATYLADNLAAGDRLELRLSGKPTVSAVATAASPHRSTGPNETQGIVVGFTALLGASVLSFLYWQGRLDLRSRSSADDAAALLQAIADLDDNYEARRVKKTHYRTQRARLKEKLVELMAEEQ